MITASLVKELREKTGVAMMECKNALKETEGDIDAAIKILRERGEAKAEKKASRDANEGIIVAALAESGKSGVLVEINCETDFVAKNENFQAFVGEVAATVLASDVTDLEAAKALPKGDETLEGFIKTKVLEMGENLQFRRFERLTLNGEGAVASYIHLGGKVGVLIEVSAEKAETASSDAFKDLVKDLTLHIAATSPAGLKREDIPAELVESEKDIFRKQMEGAGKPADILEKIIEGKLGKFYSERCLLEQGFVKEPDTSIKSLLEANGKDLGDTITVNSFLRFGLGE
ncbi:MAG: translation elongation factor Ts [Akkermansiaceae bacterium]|jgi:elongation factor Ts|nr:translation elongation factor Ts [Verrucomicrobiales bacterium]MCH1498048.1 translation elongation factor Ts [Akkermansiaceae bacterium]MDB4628623.1 translation elongation factor Ts [Akkermansiaceae bacterium]MDB4686816.1 translation elongation factor Ts [Akkermansiaceae bacterium]HAE17715.1 translation elongation factor Ts [Verrucomicrobiales bacterium]|tara:strand:+ start:6584 stop:7450 length:867 start_codon:yes stop_codon:yes gene_type:complete